MSSPSRRKPQATDAKRVTPRLLLVNKPHGVLTQFTSKDGRSTLRDVVSAPHLYPAGRLDHDSEGLVLLTNWGPLQARLTQPRSKVAKIYFAQVEGAAGDTALVQLRRGVTLNDGVTLPADAELVDEPSWLWQRDPPIRFRKNIPTSWIALTIYEGRNRQVRRMTAAVGHPTLRLIRWSVGPWTIKDLAPGESREAAPREVLDFITRRRA